MKLRVKLLVVESIEPLGDRAAELSFHNRLLKPCLFLDRLASTYRQIRLRSSIFRAPRN